MNQRPPSRKRPPHHDQRLSHYRPIDHPQHLRELALPFFGVSVVAATSLCTLGHIDICVAHGYS